MMGYPATTRGIGDILSDLNPIVQVPSLSVDPTLLLAGGGLLFLAFVLKKGEPARKRKKAKRTARRARIAGARKVLKEEGAFF